MAEDRLPGDWHRLHPDEYESAVAEAAGAIAGTLLARGEEFTWTEGFVKAHRDAVAVAFAWGYTAAKAE